MPATQLLTARERDVMALLRTHLGVREIGVRLHVSPDTVKTNVQAIYRKLGASTRSQAVTRADELGI